MSDDGNNKERHSAARVFIWMPTLDRYVFREFAFPLVVLILGFTILFLVGDLFNDLGDFLEHPCTVTQTITYFLLKIPGNVRFILPISVLLACMYTMANFGKNMEVTAMRASGVSLMRCGVPIYMAAVCVGAVNCWFNETFIPYTERESYLLRKSITTEGAYKDSRRTNLSYRSPDGRRTWLFNYFDTSETQKEVYLKHFHEDGSLDWDLKAEMAKYVSGKGWVFEHGELTRFDKENQLPGAPRKFDVMVGKPKDFPESPRDILNAVKHIEDLSSFEIYDILSKAEKMPEMRKDIYWTTLFYRMSFYPWAAIIAAFIGVPLSTKSARNGVFISIVVAIIVIISYVVLSEVFRVLGNRGDLPPLIAGAGPTVAFMLYAWWNVAHSD